MYRNIFITGGTGFLASNLLHSLLDNEDNRLYLLIRDRDSKTALQRKNALIDKAFSEPMRRKVASKISVVSGDITEENLGLSKEDSSKLRSIIDTVYHCAAIRDLSCELSTIRKVNVKGTENLLKLALDWQRNGRLENVNHISTAYIAGDYRGIFYEQATDVRQNFNNNYEQSKFEAELLVNKYRKNGLRADIYRPSIITDTVPRGANRATGLLWLLEVGILETFERVPADSRTAINMIPVDAASQAIYLISTTKNRPLNQNYHIVNPKPVRLGTLLNTASGFFGFKKPKCIPAARFDMHSLSLIQRRIIEYIIPYLNQGLSFDMHNAASVLKKHDFRIPPINKENLTKVLRCYKYSSPIARRQSYAIKK